jgi:hypothetical protein
MTGFRLSLDWGCGVRFANGRQNFQTRVLLCLRGADEAENYHFSYVMVLILGNFVRR